LSLSFPFFYISLFAEFGNHLKKETE
jgi:hypothetical protein